MNRENGNVCSVFDVERIYQIDLRLMVSPVMALLHAKCIQMTSNRTSEFVRRIPERNGRVCRLLRADTRCVAFTTHTHTRAPVPKAKPTCLGAVSNECEERKNRWTQLVFGGCDAGEPARMWERVTQRIHKCANARALRIYALCFAIKKLIRFFLNKNEWKRECAIVAIVDRTEWANLVRRAAEAYKMVFSFNCRLISLCLAVWC